MKTAARYHWNIVWHPDDDQAFATVEKEFTGTLTEAEDFEHENHPGFCCRLVEFERKGEANQ